MIKHFNTKLIAISKYTIFDHRIRAGATQSIEKLTGIHELLQIWETLVTVLCCFDKQRIEQRMIQSSKRHNLIKALILPALVGNSCTFWIVFASKKGFAMAHKPDFKKGVIATVKTIIEEWHQPRKRAFVGAIKAWWSLSG